jgi:hypothetical protein
VIEAKQMLTIIVSTHVNFFLGLGSENMIDAENTSLSFKGLLGMASGEGMFISSRKPRGDPPPFLRAQNHWIPWNNWVLGVVGGRIHRHR